MGAWGFGLFESDNAYDAIAYMEEYLDFEVCLYPEEIESVSDARKAYERRVNAFLKDEYLKDEGMVIVSAIFMMVGAKIPQNLKTKALLQIEQERACIDEMGWSDGGTTRRAVLDDFVDKLQNYVPGTLVDFSHKGLFETISDREE